MKDLMIEKQEFQGRNQEENVQGGGPLHRRTGQSFFLHLRTAVQPMSSSLGVGPPRERRIDACWAPVVGGRCRAQGAGTVGPAQGLSFPEFTPQVLPGLGPWGWTLSIEMKACTVRFHHTTHTNFL